MLPHCYTNSTKNFHEESVSNRARCVFMLQMWEHISRQERWSAITWFRMWRPQCPAWKERISPSLYPQTWIWPMRLWASASAHRVLPASSCTSARGRVTTWLWCWDETVCRALRQTFFLQLLTELHTKYCETECLGLMISSKCLSRSFICITLVCKTKRGFPKASQFNQYSYVMFNGSLSHSLALT